MNCSSLDVAWEYPLLSPSQVYLVMKKAGNFSILIVSLERARIWKVLNNTSKKEIVMLLSLVCCIVRQWTMLEMYNTALDKPAMACCLCFERNLELKIRKSIPSMCFAWIIWLSRILDWRLVTYRHIELDELLRRAFDPYDMICSIRVS